MAKLKCKNGYRYIKELGGAVNRSTISFAANWLVENECVRGRVLDFGCGFGLDADHFGWDAYDPYYRQTIPDGRFDTIVCNHVLNMLTRSNRRSAIAKIQQRLTDSGTAWLVVSRNLPESGKAAMRKRIQNYVVYDLPSLYTDEKLEIYRMDSGAEFDDLTDEIEWRLSRL